MESLYILISFVLTNVWSVLPAFLLSIVLGVLIRTLKLDRAIRNVFTAHIGWSVVLATIVGAFSPFCSCTVIPIISGLLLSGVPLAPVMAFWIASPTMDPEIFAFTVAIVGWDLAAVRLLATLLLSLGGGYLTLALTHSGLLRGSILRLHAPADGCCSSSSNPTQLAAVPAITAQGHGAGIIPLASLGFPTMPAPATPRCTTNACGVGQAASITAPAPQLIWWTTFKHNLAGLPWVHMGREMALHSWLLGRWLLLAFFLEAVITFYVPQATIATLLGSQNPLAIPLAALVGVPLYLSNITALPIVSGLLAQGMQPGAAIAFLIAGPVTTIPAMTAVWGVVQRRVFVLYLSIGLLGSVLLGALAQLVLH